MEEVSHKRTDTERFHLREVPRLVKFIETERGRWLPGAGGDLEIYYLTGTESQFQRASPGLSRKESACNAGDVGLIPGSGRPPGGGNDNPLQYSCLGNRMDRGAWRDTVHGGAELDTTEHTCGQFQKMINILEMDDRNVLDATGLYSYKWLKW